MSEHTDKGVLLPSVYLIFILMELQAPSLQCFRQPHLCHRSRAACSSA